MFLFIDLFIITSVAFLSKHASFFCWLDVKSVYAFKVGRNEPSEKLVPRRPSGSLLSAQVVLSLTVHLILLVTFQVVALQYVFHKPW